MAADPQFCLSTDAELELDGFDRLELSTGLFLHRQGGLRIVAEPSGDTVVGIQLANGGGRFARVTADGHVSADPCALRGLHYARTSTGHVIIASCQLLAARVAELRPEPRSLGAYSLNWHPTPGSAFVGLSTVLPFQQVAVRTGQVTNVEARPSQLGRSEEARASDLLERLAVAIELSAQHGELKLPLTAGLDSRTVLAAALHAGQKPECFTIAFSDGSAAEARVAANLARDNGLVHATFELQAFRSPRAVSSPLRAVWNNEDLAHVANDAYGRFSPDDILLRGGCFEVGRQYFGQLFHGITWADVVDDPALLAERARLGPLAKRRFASGVTRWVEARQCDPLDIPWLDAFYLDQRLAGWLAGAERVLEQARPTSLHPANSLGVVNNLVDEGPSGAQIQRRMIALVSEELAECPYGAAVTSGRISLRRLAGTRELVTSEVRTAGNLVRGAASRG